MIKRRYSIPVRVGDVVVGGAAPIAVQTMTKTDTRDVRATLEQIARLKDAGCEIVRPAVPDAPPSEDPSIPEGPDTPDPKPAEEPQPEGPDVPATNPKGPEVPDDSPAPGGLRPAG